MKKIFFLLALFFVLMPQGWSVQNYTCSSTAPVRINQIYNPQAGGQIGYIELYVDQGPLDMRNWKVCYSDNTGREKCIDVGNGNGKLYINGIQTGTDNPASSIPDNAFLVYPENIFNTGQGQPENTFSQSGGEAILLDGNGSAVHYLNYSTTSTYNSPEWSTGAGCQTSYLGISASNTGLCADPDFSLSITQWKYDCADTMGNYNGGMTPPPATCTSFTYDLYHPLSSTRKLQTRIAQQAFDLNVTAACVGTGTLPNKKITNIYALNTADACTITSPNLQVWSNPTGIDINDTVKNITLTGLNSTKAFSNIKLMLKTSDNLYYCSTDSMAMRPSSFNITSPVSSIKASDFNLSVSAINSGSGYHGTANINTALQTSNANCPISTGFITSSTGTSLVFVNDTNTTKMKATDVGSIFLNVKDTSWTAIDQANDCISNSNTTTANAQGLVGCNIENNLSLTIIPNHFDVNATLSNFTGGSFTYLSTDLAMSANIDVNITAKNSDGNVTKNFTSGCFAKTTSLNLPHSSVPSPLSKILYRDTVNAIDNNVSASSPLTLTFDQNKFTQGSTLPKVTFNFDRNSSKPLNPFDFNLTSADVNNTDNVIGTTVPAGKATFVYGRARAYDIKTDQPSAPNPIELEVYSSTSSGYVNGMPQNILHWYRNLNHNTLNEGRVIGGGFTVGMSDNIKVNTSTIPINGIHPITITSATNQTVHLDIPTWLWYSPTYNYNYTTSCLEHPCFNYQFFGTSTNSSGVQSGTFQGSDFTLTPAKTIIKKGVKVFR